MSIRVSGEWEDELRKDIEKVVIDHVSDNDSIPVALVNDSKEIDECINSIVTRLLIIKDAVSNSTSTIPAEKLKDDDLLERDRNEH